MLRASGIATSLALIFGVAPPFAMANEGESVEEIVVKGRWDSRLGLAVSASEGVIGQGELDLRPRLRTGDMLEAVPGLIVTQHSGTGKSNQMFLRGFNLDHGTDFATWIDGMPINLPTHGHGQGYTDLNFIIPELVETLEFRKGPYYTGVSDFSAAGTASFSLMRELDGPLVRAGVGENAFRRLLAADSYEVGSGELLVGLQGHRYDGPWVDISEDLNATTGVLRYSQTEEGRGDWGITFMGYDARWNSADQIPRRAVEGGLISRLGSLDDTVGGDTSRYSLSGRWHRDFGPQTLTLSGYFIDYELDLYSNFTYFLDDPEGGDQFLQVDDRNTWGGEAVWQFRANADTTHRAGTVLRVDDIDDVGLFRTLRRAPTSIVRQDSVHQLSAGLFYDVEHRFNERWRATLGARVDWYDFDVRQSNIDANTGQVNDSIVSPKLNVIRTLSDTSELYFSAGSAFHSNDARGTVIQIDPVTGEPATPVDPLVRASGAEIGYRFFDDERINISAALWYLELDSELLFVGDAGNTEPSAGSQRYGLEFPVYVRLDDTWMFDAELALTRSRFTEGEQGEREIPGSLDRVFAAGISGQFANGFYTSLRLRHFGPRPLNESGEVESGSSTVWNLGVGVRRASFDLRLEALNLFDAEADDITYFYASRLPGEPADGVEDVHFHPIEPQMLRLYLTWSPGG
jgi:outer membrane receptor protein involved in Fe transport